jgi:magnesium transporter
LPPTLIASIYGMNFDILPELHLRLGYPMALIAMLIAGILPYVWFKRRGWL